MALYPWFLGRRIHINQSAEDLTMNEWICYVRMDSDMKFKLALTAKRKIVTMSKL